MKRQTGFTIIELLVVIAIIGILAAIIFPVYAQAKKSAYRSSDMTNMNSLRTALQLYKADSGSFPPALLGYVNPYENIDGANNVVPPNQVKGALYPRRVESLSILRPAYDRVSDNPGTEPYNASLIDAGSDPMVTPAVWPYNASLWDGSDGTRNRQRYGPSDGTVKHAATNPADGTCHVVPSYYYRVSGYDAAPVQGPGGARYETHYQLFWSAWNVPTDPCNPDPTKEMGSLQDDPRQLGYLEPPETTVVTWNAYFRDYDAGVPTNTKQDLVLFLAGNARPMDSASVASSAWQVKP